MEHSHILSAVDNPEWVSGMFWVKQKRHQLHKRVQLNYRAPSLSQVSAMSSFRSQEAPQHFAKEGLFRSKYEEYTYST